MTADISYLIPLAIIGFIGLVVGALVGFLAAGMRDVSRTTKPKRNRDLVEVIRIWHDRRSGELTMEVGGKFYKKVSELNEKTRRGFMVLLNELQSWLGIPDIDQRLGDITSRPLPVTGQKPTKTSPSGSDESLRPASSSSTLQSPVTPVTEKEIKLQTPEDNDKILAAKSTGVEVTEVRSHPLVLEDPKETPQELKSIAAQVDEILQEKLADSPHKDHVVRLLELPGGGMVVMVNSAQYNGVGEVPDPEIRQILQDSVAEWERRLSVR